MVGNRQWKRGILLVDSTYPEPFTVMPISYDNAFGGIDHSQEDPLEHRWFATNHVGVGHEYLDGEFIDGKPLPNTGRNRSAGDYPQGKYRPMSFGPIGPWQPRPLYAGTYDQGWLETRPPSGPTTSTTATSRPPRPSRCRTPGAARRWCSMI